MAELASALPWVESEAELVTELQAGSEEAFDCLVTHFHGLVYNLLYNALGDPADAADATQEVFLKAARGIRGFRRSSSLKTWLYRIALREASNQRRWRWRHRRGETSLDAQNEDGSAALELTDTSATPFERLASSEVQYAVRSAMAQVPDVFRSAVILRDLEGLSYEQIAEVLEISVGTVKSRILRGRRVLRELLEPVLNGRDASRHARREPRSTRGYLDVSSAVSAGAGRPAGAMMAVRAEASEWSPARGSDRSGGFTARGGGK